MTQHTLPPGGADYPQRPPFFANRYLRQLLDSGAVQITGTEAFALLTVIVMTEDLMRYQRPPCFWNATLERQLNWSEDKLDRVRRKACNAGLLHYDRDGCRSQGFYWVLSPAWLETLPPAPESPAPLPPILRGMEPITRTGAGDSADVNAGDSADANAGLTFLNSPIPNSPPSPSPSEATWAVVEREMFRQGIHEARKPLESLASNHVPPALALDVLRYASETGAWEPGKVRRRLINLRPGDDARDPHGWMKPDRPDRVPQSARSTLPSGSDASAQRQSDARYRQLELFEDQVAGKTPQAIADAFAIPEPIRNRLVEYESWERIQQRNSALRYAVLEAIAHSISEN